MVPPRPRFRAVLPAVFLGLLVLAGGPSAQAQTPQERAGARAAATKGAEAYEAGRWSEAVDLFSRAESLVHSPVHLLYLARAHVQLGQLVLARENYIRVISEDVSRAHPVIREAKENAEKELEALEPRIPYISVVVQGAGPKPVKVVMDGAEIPSALLGVPQPVNPGEHEYQAFAEGMESSKTSIKVPEGRSETVVLTLKGIPGWKKPEAASETEEADAPPPSEAVAEDRAPEDTSILPVLGWVSLGVGVVGLGAGTLFALQGKSKVDEANEICSLQGGACPDTRQAEVEDLDDGARSANTLATVGFVVGGVGIAGGITLLLLGSGGGGGESSAAAPGVRPQIGLGYAGIAGAF
jgi:hypothetical protein